MRANKKILPQNPFAITVRLGGMDLVCIREEMFMTELSEKAKQSWVLALAANASCMVAFDALAVTT